MPRTGPCVPAIKELGNTVKSGVEVTISIIIIIIIITVIRADTLSYNKQI